MDASGIAPLPRIGLSWDRVAARSQNRERLFQYPHLSILDYWDKVSGVISLLPTWVNISTGKVNGSLDRPQVLFHLISRISDRQIPEEEIRPTERC